MGLPEYAHSGFSAATLRGADFRSARSAADRMALALALAEEHDGALVYCYLPEVDKAGHKHGVASAEWVAALEDLDAAMPPAVPSGVGVLVTADHGMVDVPRTRHLIIDEHSPLQNGVAAIAGEPRMLHVYLEDAARADEVAARWRRGHRGRRGRAHPGQAVQGGLFGAEVTPEPRTGSATWWSPRGGMWALYDGAAEDQRAQGMIGQHGSLSPEELRVPLLRFGAFAR